MCESHADADPRDLAADVAATRRVFLLLGLAAFAGCAKQAVVTSMPSPPWTETDSKPLNQRHATDKIAPPSRATAPPTSPPAGVLARSGWAQGRPVPSNMNRMTTIRYITIHHDGMDPFFGTDRQSSAAHLELIRRLHRRKGWGDIGYHFAVDRGGRVWEARPLAYQGAHVKDHNPGNIGIVVLGNFEEQSPSDAQMEAMRRHIVALMRRYKVPARRVQTHQEWGAHTACPGGRLQVYLDRIRRKGRLG